MPNQQMGKVFLMTCLTVGFFLAAIRLPLSKLDGFASILNGA
jgi:hypothetical protein